MDKCWTCKKHNTIASFSLYCVECIKVMVNGK